MPIVSTVLSAVHGGRLSHDVNGMSQPPKNSVTISELDVMMLAYSAIGNIEYFMELYSAW